MATNTKPNTLNALHPMEIPIIFEKICSFLLTKDLMKIRCLNQHYYSTVTRILKRNGPDNYPMVTIKNIHQITTHLSFLEKRKYKSNLWFRNYHLDLHMSDPSSVDCMNYSVKLIDDYRQQISSMILRDNHIFDDHFKANVPQYQKLTSEVKNMRYAFGESERNDPKYPQYMNFTSNKPYQYFCVALWKRERTTKLEHLTISLDYLTFNFIKDVAVMSGLKVLRMFVHVDSHFNNLLFKFLRANCPRLKELYLIRYGVYKRWNHLAEHSDYFEHSTNVVSSNDKNWLKNTRKLQTEFRKIKIVMEKRY